MKRALVSVSDKTGLVDFVRGLVDLGWEIIATGGTQKLLEKEGVKTIGISEVTGFPEILDGRVKTLHPKVHGGILARRDLQSHMDTLKENGVETIDLVCVNLYPFKQTIAKEGVTLEDAIENIDIGGPSMVRSAAKNWRDVTIVCNPADYDTVLAELRENGCTSPETRLKLSAKAYTHTAEYDACIATYMRAQAGLPEKLFLEYDIKQPLRYGENPHQSANFYAALEPAPFSLAFAKQIQGKELSYNNIQDANAALNVLRDFEEPFCVALKHMNPCGAAVGKTIEEAWQAAYEADKVSIYGGIVGVNRELTAEVARGMKPIFLEIVIAPSYTPEALEILSTKKNLRVMQVDMTRDGKSVPQYVSVNGGLLVQQLDTQNVRDEGEAHRGADGRPQLRLEDRQACEIQRDLRRPRQPHHRRGRRPDEPRRFRRNRPRGGEGRRFHREPGPFLRRFPPVRRHRGPRRQVRRDRHRAARRQHP